MAKRGAKSSGGAAPPELDAASSPVTPAPPKDLHVTLTTLGAGEVLHRVHLEKYDADQFNPGIHGNARFSPIQDERGEPIPTLYAGTTMPCALMETVFHDVPHVPGFKSFDKGKLVGQQHSTVEVIQDLQLADLGSLSLRKLGIPRKQLIDTEKDQYPVTQKWAEAVHHQCPEAQGLSWVSRQDDSARAFVFFGDRVPAGIFRQQGRSRSLLEDIDAYDEVLNLADRIGVSIVSGKN
jgi:hypothetical protein